MHLGGLRLLIHKYSKNSMKVLVFNYLKSLKDAKKVRADMSGGFKFSQQTAI